MKIQVHRLSQMFHCGRGCLSGEGAHMCVHGHRVFTGTFCILGLIGCESKTALIKLIHLERNLSL